jgi:hypothetical protein
MRAHGKLPEGDAVPAVPESELSSALLPGR